MKAIDTQMQVRFAYQLVVVGSRLELLEAIRAYAEVKVALHADLSHLKPRHIASQSIFTRKNIGGMHLRHWGMPVTDIGAG